MTTPTHVAVNAGVFLGFVLFSHFHPTYLDLGLIVGANLIDLDHLFSRPIYHPKRNPFKIHFLHKHWLIITCLCFISLFYRSAMFFAMGILLHYALDYVYIKREGV